jgi:hypothetical protein
MKTFRSIEEEVETMSEKELLYWNKGFLAAIEGILGQIQDDQIRILDKLMSINTENKGTKALLESRLVILDAYEDHYRKRLLTLESDCL